MDQPTSSTALLLQRMSKGDAAAADELMPVLYEELHKLARRNMEGERPGHTLQPTALVGEAWARLLGGPSPATWESRGHFLRIAARAMRNVLVDHARAKQALKRGKRADLRSDYVEQLLVPFVEQSLDVLAIHEALDRMRGMDAGLAELVELRFFAGLSIPETARALGVSESTVERSWRVARAWLRREVPRSVE